jgi:CO/xanthine dehydrogenase Mo-binding subunit
MLKDAYRHTSGQTRYADDFIVPGMLYAKTAHVPVPHAKILSINTEAAERTPGVAGVITYKDIPVNYWGAFVQDQPVLADKYARHLRQPVVAIAAVDEDTAYEAAGKVKIDYEELPPVFDPEEAMKPGAVEVHEGGNIARFAGHDAIMVRLGDVDKGFAEADFIFEDRGHAGMREHAFLETHCSVAIPDVNGYLTIHTAAQTTSWHQFLLSSILAKPIHKIRMIASPTGGGFGGKSNPSTEPIAALLAMKTGRPVKWRWTREEEFLISTVSSADTFYLKTGFKKDGTLIAQQVKYIRDNGAYNDFGTYGMLKLTSQFNGPYRVPNFWFDGYVVYTNKQVTGPLRGYSLTQSIHAIENHMEMAAAKAGLDPVEVRRKNLVRDGDMLVTQQVLEAVGVEKTLDAVLKASNWYGN